MICKIETLFAATSIAMAITIWPIICYNFVINCLQFFLQCLSWSKHMEDSSEELIEDNLYVFDIAMVSTAYISKLICEGAVVVGLVIQFMSSFDYFSTAVNEYERNWWDCHKLVFIIFAGTLPIKLLVFTLNVLKYDSTFEMYAILLNTLFLLLVILDNLKYKRYSSVSLEKLNSPTQELNIESFLDLNTVKRLPKEFAETEEKDNHSANLGSRIDSLDV